MCRRLSILARAGLPTLVFVFALFAIMFLSLSNVCIIINRITVDYNIYGIKISDQPRINSDGIKTCLMAKIMMKIKFE